MLYTVKRSGFELAVLGRQIGKPLERVTSDGFGAELHCGGAVLCVLPEDAATPDKTHPSGDVDRPLVRLESDPAPSGTSHVLGEHLGIVRAVNVLSLLIGFTEVKEFPAGEYFGMTLPAHTGYGWLYLPPQLLEQARHAVGEGALVDLDIAFELVCDARPSVVIYTAGHLVQVSLNGLPANEDWCTIKRYSRRSLDANGQPGVAHFASE